MNLSDETSSHSTNFKVSTSKPSTSRDTLSSVHYAEQGRQLRNLRLKHNFTIKKLAAQLAISEVFLQKIESGARIPSEQLRDKMKNLLDSEQIASIEWPSTHSPSSYNYRTPQNSPPGSLGLQLKQWRLALPNHPSQEEIALKLGIGAQKYGRIERGYLQTVSAELIERLSQVFGVDVQKWITSSATHPIKNEE